MNAEIKTNAQASIELAQARVRIAELEQSVSYLQDALKLSEEQNLSQLAEIEAIYKSAHFGLCVFDTGLRIKRINARMAEMRGLSIHEYMGRRIHDIFPELNSFTEDIVHQIFKSGQSVHNIEFRWPANAPAAEQRIWIEQWLPLTDSTGKVTGINVIAEEVTEHKRAEEAVLKSEFNLSEAQRIAHIGSWEWNIKSDEIIWSDEMYRIHGLYPGCIVPDYQTFLTYVHTDDVNCVAEDMRQMVTKGKGGILEYRIVLPDSRVRTLQLKAEIVVFDDNGNPHRMLGITQDITERLLAETALRESEQRYRALVDLAPDAVVVHQEGDILYANSTGLSLFGAASFEQLSLYSLIDDLLHPEDRDLVKAQLGDVDQKGRTPLLESRILRLDGEVVPVESSSIPVIYKGVSASQAIIRDISERKRAQAELKESEQRYCSLFNAMTEGFALHEIILNAKGKPCDYRFLDMNPAFERYTGLKHEEVIGKLMSEVMPEEDPHLLDVYGKVALTGKPVHFENYSPSLKRHYAVFAYCPAPRQFATVFMDITQRKRAEESMLRHRNRLDDLVKEQAMAIEDRNVKFDIEIIERMRLEEALRTSEERFRMITQTSTEVFWMCSVDFSRMFYVSPGYERVWGQSLTSLYENPLSYIDAIHEQDREIICKQTHTIENRKAGIPFSIEYRVVQPDGAIAWVWDRGYPVYDDKDKVIYYVGVAQDISVRKQAEEEKKRLENQLIQTQKMEALGKFAGGIAHDLNNILYSIIIDMELLLDEYAPDMILNQKLTQVLKAAYRQRDLVKQILSFSRRSDFQFNPISIIPVMKETLVFLRSSLPSTIEITQDINATLDTILGDPIQIQQIIVNLCGNAADALGARIGTITVSLANTYLEPVQNEPDIRSGNYLELKVKDTGYGMSPEVMDHIFEPFFTTKEIGKGSGMGLAVVHGIVKSHKGAIVVKSEPGQGSEFTVYLPVTDNVLKSSRISSDKAPSIQGKGRILLVDDEDIVLTSIKNALKRLGYDVTAINDSVQAQDLFYRSPEKFDLVITDLTMPKKSGMELTRSLIQKNPAIPIILCTGFNDIIDEDEAKGMGIRELLIKPASINELKVAIAKALEN